MAMVGMANTDDTVMVAAMAVMGLTAHTVLMVHMVTILIVIMDKKKTTLLRNNQS